MRNFFQNIRAPKQTKVDADQRLLELANEATLNLAKAKNSEYPMEFRVERFNLARQQAMEVLKDAS